MSTFASTSQKRAPNGFSNMGTFATMTAVAMIAGTGTAVAKRASSSDLNSELRGTDEWWEDDLKRAGVLLSQLNDEHPGNPEVLWRLARVTYNDAYANDDQAVKKEGYERAMAFCEQAINCGGSGVSAVHKWYAIVLSELSSLQGTKASIESAYVVKEHFDRAAELDPNDPNCWHFLGRWSFTIASIGWWSRQIAATIFASPPTSSFEEALRYFEKAEAIQPGFWKSNVFFVAKCHSELGDKTKAREWSERAQKMPTKTAEDRQTQEEINEFVKSL